MTTPSKLPSVGTTIFTVMSQLALEHNAINLGQGFPDFNPDAQLLRYVSEAMAQGYNQYPAMAGVPELRTAISKKIQDLYQYNYDPTTEITITSGATEGLMSSIQALIHPGDEVLVLEPCYDVYIPAITLAGGTPVFVPLTPPSAETPTFRIDWNRVLAAISAKTRALIINFPHNPTGIILKETDLDALEEIVQKHNIVLISDEAYEHIVLHQQKHLSMATRPALAARSVVVCSFGKTYHTTGWKIGYCCAPPALTNEIRKVHQFAVFTVSSPMQYGLAHFLEHKQAYLDLPSFYQEKYQVLHTGLNTTRFRPLHSEGTFFLVADYSAISSLPEEEFSRQMTIQHQVTTIPMSAFYQNPHAPESNQHLLRFCFAKQTKTLDLAISRLRQI